MEVMKIEQKLQAAGETHPCFTAGCTQYARLHLPVAPCCNVQCNYCVRKFSCVNESRPGVAAAVLTPEEALQRFLEARARVPQLTVAGIAGPGDALANWPQVRHTLELIRHHDKKIKLCLSTNGLMLPQHAEALAALGVGYLTVTVNSVREETLAQIYAYIADADSAAEGGAAGITNSSAGSRLTGASAGRLLLARQTEGIRLAKRLGMTVKINTVVLPGINLQEMTEIAAWAQQLHCDVMNIIPMLPVAGSKFAALPAPEPGTIAELRRECAVYLRQMYHCRRCRADALGTLVPSSLT